MPVSAMKRKALPCLSVLAASPRLAFLKKPLRAALASPEIFRLSYSLVMRMYQLPMLMITRMISVPLATKSPCAHSADSPYGLSMVSLLVEAVGGAAGTVAAGSEAAGACACAGSGTNSASNAHSVTANRARRTRERRSDMMTIQSARDEELKRREAGEGGYSIL
jgi:hypothetical protein